MSDAPPAAAFSAAPCAAAALADASGEFGRAMQTLLVDERQPA